jgi:hypothetical protein
VATGLKRSAASSRQQLSTFDSGPDLARKASRGFVGLVDRTATARTG